MDSNGLMSLNREKKNAPITEGGIRISKPEEEIKRSRSVSDMENPAEMFRQPVTAEKKDGEKEVKEDTDRKNRKLARVGEAYLGDIAENEIELDLGEEELNDLSQNLSRISQKSERALKAGENRLLKLGHIPETASKNAVKASASLRIVGNRVIKNGRFREEAITAGLDFMKKVDRWAGRSEDPSESERDYYRAIGSADTVDFLYVDGKPLKEFVKDQYGYTGSENKNEEKGILSAYAAMITYRQNHPITLVRPTYINGHADVDIRPLSVDMTELAGSRSAKVKVIGNALQGEQYRQYCESVYRSDMRARSAVAAGIAEKVGRIGGIDKLTKLKEQLKAAGKGSHRNYDEFVWAFHKYYDAVILLSSNPGDRKINRVTLESLDHLNSLAASAARAYLKGKKMNLPRHKAVDNIRALLFAQGGKFGKYLRELGKDKTGEKTVELSDLLAEEDSGFVVVGIEEEIRDLKQRAENNENDLNQYTSLDEDIGLSVRQRQLLRLKNEISADQASGIARDALYNAMNASGVPEDVVIGHALTFLRCAASAILKNNDLKKLKQKYPYAENHTDMLLAIIARTTLTRVYSDEFKKIPAFQLAMDMWNEQISSEEARAMTYQSNFVGDKISKKDFDEKGGSAYKRYVTRMEAKEISAATHGYLAYKEVKDRPDIVRLVPSMPEFTTIYKGEASEKKIPLRKTLKTMYKTFARLATDENGRVKTQPARYKEDTVTSRIDELLRISGTDKRELAQAEEFIAEVVLPEMTAMLENEYRQKRIRGYKNRAYNDAFDICKNYLELVKGCNAGLITSAPDVSFDTFVHTVNFVNSVKTEDIMKFRKFGDYRINGRTLTAEEVSEALEDYKAEMRENETEFASFRNIDTDDVEMPSVTSCNDNAQINEVTMMFLVNGEESHARLDYELKHVTKTDPNAALDALIANLDNILDTKFGNEDSIKKDREKILALDEKRKKGELTREDKNDLKVLYAGYAKYDWHRGANLGKVGNALYTTETMAPLPNELVKSPFTNKVLIGKYVSDKPMETDEDTGVQRHEAMNGFYDHDDAFAHCRDHKQVVKIAVKDIIRQMVDKLM